MSKAGRAAAMTAAAGLMVVPTVMAAGGVDERSRVSGRGLGAIEIGMSKAAAERAGGIELAGGSGRGCHYLRPRDKSIRALFMMNKGRIVRVDIERRGIRTNKGVRVGDSEAAVRERFEGRLRVAPNKYRPGGSDLTFLPIRGNRRVIAETDGQKITLIRAGRLPEVTWVERCG